MDIHYDDINYSDVVTFIYAVRFGTISRAAEKLNISQPAASKRIASLERNYDIQLFIRKGKSLQLTNAGKVFYDEMIEALDHIVSAFSRAADVQSNPIHTLRIGYDGFFDVPILYKITSLFSDHRLNVRTELMDYSTREENCADLFNGNADILISPDAWFSSLKDQVSYKNISAFQFSILVPETNPMSQRKSLSVSDLQDVPLTIAHPNDDSPYVNAIRNIFMKYGLRPRIEHLTNRENLCLDILSNGNIAIATSAFFRQKNSREENFYNQRIRVYPIENEYYPVSFVWRKNNSDSNIRRFIKIYDRVIKEGENRKIIEQCYGA